MQTSAASCSSRTSFNLNTNVPRSCAAVRRRVLCRASEVRDSGHPHAHPSILPPCHHPHHPHHHPRPPCWLLQQQEVKPAAPSAPPSFVKKYKSNGVDIIESDAPLGGPEDQNDPWEGDSMEVIVQRGGAQACLPPRLIPLDSAAQQQQHAGGIEALDGRPALAVTTCAVVPRLLLTAELWHHHGAFLPAWPGRSGAHLRRHRRRHLQRGCRHIRSAVGVVLA